MKISCIIAIKDERETYKQTLSQVLPHVDECIVADIGMDDEMSTYVSSLKNVTVVHPKLPVPYIELIRQSLIDKASHEWILLLDPDEVVTSDLAKYLKKHADTCDYMRIPRKNIIMNKWMEHSRWWPDYQVRFFKKKSATWGTRIHSQPDLRGVEHVVPAEEKYALEHYNYLTFDSYLSKSFRYARAEAQGYIDRKEDFTLEMALRKGVSEFVSRFFAADGYKDGLHGFVMAFSQFMYYFQVGVYVWENKGYPNISDEEVRRLPLNAFSHALHEVSHWSRVKKLVNDPLSRIRSALIKRL